MKYLARLISKFYPNKLFRLHEAYYRDEVYNICIEYNLWVQDTINRQFETFQELENFICKICGEENE